MDERQKIGAGVGCATIVAIFFVAVSVFGLVYQTRPDYFIQVGSRLDRPYLVESSFNTREPVEKDRKGDFTDYRWTKGESFINLPGVGSQAVTVTLRVFSGESPDRNLGIFVNNFPVPDKYTALPPKNTFGEIAFPVPPDWFKDGTLHLKLKSTLWKDPGANRYLGVSLDWVKVQPNLSQPNDFIRPPDDTYLPLLIISVLVILIFLTIGIPTLYALAAGVAVIGGLAVWLVADRLSLTTLVAQDFLRTLFFLWIGVYAAAEFGPTVFRWLGVAVTRRESGWLAGLFLLQFVLLFSFMIHPQFTSSDLGLSIRHVTQVQSGTWLLSEELPNKQIAPYPPAFYVLLLPFTNFTNGSVAGLGSLILNANTILFSSSVYLVFYLSSILRRPIDRDVTDRDMAVRELLERQYEAGTNWAGIIAAALVIVSTYPYYIFSQGNHANLFGAWVFLLFVCMIAGTLHYLRGEATTAPPTSPIVVAVNAPEPALVGRAGSKFDPPTPPPFALVDHPLSPSLDDNEDAPPRNLVSRVSERFANWLKVHVWPRGVRVLRYLLPLLVLVGVFLSHYGTFLFANVFVICYIGVMLLFGGKRGRRDAIYIVTIYALALLIAFFLYYNHYLNVIGRSGSSSKSGFDLFGLLRRLYSDSRKDFGLITLIAAVAGLVLWYLTRHEPLAKGEKLLAHLKSLQVGPVAAALIALGLTGLAFALFGNLIGLESRYQLYILPVIALAAGAFFGRIWRSGVLGVVLVTAFFLFQLLAALSFWLERVTYYFYN